MFGKSNWHTVVIKPTNELYVNWHYIKPWLSKHCEGEYLFTANVIKFKLESDMILFKLGYKDNES